MTRIPNTTTVVSYAYSVKAPNGESIGTLQGFTPTANRNVERVREIMNELQDTIEIVPGRTDFSITLDRLETYDKTMMEALGFTDFNDLSQVTNPITIMEEIVGPVAGGSRRRTVAYQGCWVQSVSKTVREGTITVSEQVTIQVTRIVASKSY